MIVDSEAWLDSDSRIRINFETLNLAIASPHGALQTAWIVKRGLYRILQSENS